MLQKAACFLLLLSQESIGGIMHYGNGTKMGTGCFFGLQEKVTCTLIYT